MNYIRESFAQLLGRAPKKPAKEDILPPAQEIHFYKKANKVITREYIMKLHEEPHKNTWRNRRWLTLLAVNLLFVVSYWLDIQLLEGALTASRFMGFHMADLNSALQVMLAFKEVLINLIENARAAGAENVTMRLAAGTEMEIAVQDDGPGISPEDLPRVLEPQFSTTTSGAGLGLAICRRLVESWGGRITVASGAGQGTTVRLMLRLAG